MMTMRRRVMYPRCRRSPAVVSMIMARRRMAKSNNHITQKRIKSQAETRQETVRGRKKRSYKLEISINTFNKRQHLH